MTGHCRVAKFLLTPVEAETSEMKLNDRVLGMRIHRDLSATNFPLAWITRFA